MITKIQRELLELAPEITQTAIDKGFWKDGTNRNKGEMVMLMVSELGECLEAHRAGKTVHQEYAEFNDWAEQATSQMKELLSEDEFWMEWYKNQVKGTYQEEIADVVIRVLDYIGGWGMGPFIIARETNWKPGANFGEDLMHLVGDLNYVYRIEQHAVHPNRIYLGWSSVLAECVVFCRAYNIDILSHVRWKMAYNRTREHLHGKQY